MELQAAATEKEGLIEYANGFPFFSQRQLHNSIVDSKYRTYLLSCRLNGGG